MSKFSVLQHKWKIVLSYVSLKEKNHLISEKWLPSPSQGCRICILLFCAWLSQSSRGKVLRNSPPTIKIGWQTLSQRKWWRSLMLTCLRWPIREEHHGEWTREEPARALLSRTFTEALPEVGWPPGWGAGGRRMARRTQGSRAWGGWWEQTCEESTCILRVLGTDHGFLPSGGSEEAVLQSRALFGCSKSTGEGAFRKLGVGGWLEDRRFQTWRMTCRKQLQTCFLQGCRVSPGISMFPSSPFLLECLHLSLSRDFWSCRQGHTALW